MTAAPTPPATTAALITALLAGGTGVELIAVLGGGTARQVHQWANAQGPGPTARGTTRLRVAFEAGTILAAGSFDAAAVRAWWEDSFTLASQGTDSTPADLLRWEPLNESAKIILEAARSVTGVKTVASIAWTVPRTLILLDVDGCLLPFDDGRAVDTNRLTALDVFHPPLKEPSRFYYDGAVIAAIRRWVASGVELHWHTSWGPAAPGLLAPLLGLPPAPLFAERSLWDYMKRRPWKRWAVLNYVAELPENHRTRILWVDDLDARSAGAQLRGLRQPGKLEGSLVLEPVSHRGISPSQLAAAEAFLSRQPTAADAAPLASGQSRVLATVDALATAIRDGRKTKHFTQAQLAAAAGLSGYRIGELEAGRMRAEDLAAAVKVLETLGIHAVALPGVASTVKLEDIDLAEHVKRFGQEH
ncbi:hypothetical protein B5P43_15610 [Bacillus sp. SRB_336]|nr:hypothetical protein B5P43_15610 [Bacillus sp. SRB_336]